MARSVGPVCLGENIVARNALGNRGGQGVFQLQLQSKRFSLMLEAEEKMQKIPFFLLGTAYLMVGSQNSF